MALYKFTYLLTYKRISSTSSAHCITDDNTIRVISIITVNKIFITTAQFTIGISLSKRLTKGHGLHHIQATLEEWISQNTAIKCTQFSHLLHIFRINLVQKITINIVKIELRVSRESYRKPNTVLQISDPQS